MLLGERGPRICITLEGDTPVEDLLMVAFYTAIGCALAYAWSLAEVVWEALRSYLRNREEDKHNEELDRLDRERAEALEEAHPFTYEPKEIKDS